MTPREKALEAAARQMCVALTPFAMAYNADHWHNCLSIENLRKASAALAAFEAAMKGRAGG